MKKLIMSYPSKKIGGVQTLTYRIIKENSVNNESIVIDYLDGSISMLLKNDNVNFKLIDYNKRNKMLLKQSIEELDISKYNYLTFISPRCNGYINSEICNINNNVFYWIVAPENMLYFYSSIGRISKIKYKKLFAKVFFKLLYEKCRLFFLENIKNEKIFFMDYENFWYNNYFFDLNLTSEDVKFLPIPIEIYNENNWMQNKRGLKELNLCWLGTLVPSKIITLKKLILDINHVCFNYANKIRLNIIGDGPCLTEIKDYINKNDISYNIVFKGTLIQEQLNKELLKNDIFFAMGTSALEGAKLGIPTVLVDALTFIPNEYKYNWLFETYYYTLGKVVTRDRENEINEKGYSLDKIIIQYLENYKEISQKCFEYCSNHDTNNVYKKMNKYFEEAEGKVCNITYNDIVNEKNKNIISKISKAKNNIINTNNRII